MTADEFRLRRLEQPWQRRLEQPSDDEIAEMKAEQARLEAMPLSQRPQGQRRPQTADIFGLFFIAWPIAVAVGIALFVACLLQGLPAWVALVATPVGLIGGWVLCWVVDEVAWTVVDRLALRSTWADRHAGNVLRLVSSILLLIPAAVTILVSLALLRVIA